MELLNALVTVGGQQFSKNVIARAYRTKLVSYLTSIILFIYEEKIRTSLGSL